MKGKIGSGYPSLETKNVGIGFIKRKINHWGSMRPSWRPAAAWPRWRARSRRTKTGWRRPKTGAEII